MSQITKFQQRVYRSRSKQEGGTFPHSVRARSLHIHVSRCEESNWTGVAASEREGMEDWQRGAVEVPSARGRGVPFEGEARRVSRICEGIASKTWNSQEPRSFLMATQTRAVSDFLQINSHMHTVHCKVLPYCDYWYWFHRNKTDVTQNMLRISLKWCIILIVMKTRQIKKCIRTLYSTLRY